MACRKVLSRYLSGESVEYRNKYVIIDVVCLLAEIRKRDHLDGDS